VYVQCECLQGPGYKPRNLLRWLQGPTHSLEVLQMNGGSRLRMCLVRSPGADRLRTLVDVGWFTSSSVSTGPHPLPAARLRGQVGPGAVKTGHGKTSTLIESHHRLASTRPQADGRDAAPGGQAFDRGDRAQPRCNPLALTGCIDLARGGHKGWRDRGGRPTPSRWAEATPEPHAATPQRVLANTRVCWDGLNPASAAALNGEADS